MVLLLALSASSLASPLDSDGDGWPDVADNCAAVANPWQADRDFDGAGDACDPCAGVGTGSGGLGPAQRMIGGVFGWAPADLHVVDVDGDGVHDTVIVATDADALLPGDDVLMWIEENPDDDTFLPHIVDDTLRGVRQAVAADVDHDGDLDLVVATDTELRFAERVLADHFLPTVAIDSLSGSVSEMEAFDVDRDGFLDLVVAIDDRLVTRLSGPGGLGAPTPVPKLDAVVGLSVGNLYDDGEPELGVTTPDGVELFHGSAVGLTLVANIAWPGLLQSVVTEDGVAGLTPEGLLLEWDPKRGETHRVLGEMEGTLGAFHDGAWNVWTDEGTYRFTTTGSGVEWIGGPPSQVAQAPDAAVARRTEAGDMPKVAVWAGDRGMTSDPNGGTPIDFDANGVDDPVLGLRDLRSRWGARWRLEVLPGGGPYDAVWALFFDDDGDGDDDLFNADMHGRVWKRDNDVGVFGPEVYLQSSVMCYWWCTAELFQVVDVDDDGLNDLLASLDGDGIWWRRESADEVLMVQVAPGAEHLAIADVDLDGDLDLLSTPREAPFALQLHEASSPGAFLAPVVLDDLSARARTLDAGDIDGDGRDELWAVLDDGTMRIYADEGAGYVAELVPHAAPIEEAVAADLDGDGVRELFLIDAEGITWQGPAGPTLITPPMEVPVLWQRLRFGDLDGDGDTDPYAYSNGAYYWFPNELSCVAPEPTDTSDTGVPGLAPGYFPAPETADTALPLRGTGDTGRGPSTGTTSATRRPPETPGGCGCSAAATPMGRTLGWSMLCLWGLQRRRRPASSV